MIVDMSSDVSVRTDWCEVWWATQADEQPWHLETLSLAERERRDALWRAEDRARFTVACTLLRVVVSRHLGCSPADAPIHRSCPDCSRPHGKPEVPGTGLHVSLSHSGDRIVVAATYAGPVGVDVEEFSPDLNVPAMAPAILSPAELAEWTGATPDDFYAYWTRKESVLKATGHGLRAPMNGVTVSRPNEAARLLAADGIDGAAAASHMQDLHLGRGYAAAITVLTSAAPRIRTVNAATLLYMSR